MSGLLGKAALAANSNTVLYTVPEGIVTTLSVLMVNRGTEAAAFRVAISDSDVPSVGEYIEYDAVISSAGGVFERTGLVCSAGERVVIFSDSASVSVRVHGFEQEAI